MNNGKTTNRMVIGQALSKALMLAALFSASTPTLAAEYWLRAEAFNMTLPGGGGRVQMWGFAECKVDGAGLWVCEPPTVPGPVLNVLPNDTTGLTVHVRNMLTTEPVSLVINGQDIDSLSTPANSPVWTDGTVGPRGADTTKRVRSFVHEAPKRVGSVYGSADYKWPSIKPGTYLYQSGTHPQVQVQMGLYGAMTKSTTQTGAIVDGVQQGGTIYGATYDRQQLLLLSELDPALHAAVAAGTYGTGAFTSTINYNPKYFFINGKALSGNKKTPLIQIKAGERTLLRFLNAGLQTRVPMIPTDGPFSVIAEDGNAYPYPRQQYTLNLAAAKTMDVIYNGKMALSAGKPADALHAVYDRRLALNNGTQSNGGMMAFLEVKKTGNPPVISSPAANSILVGTQNVPFSVQVNATDPEANPITYTLDQAPLGMTIEPVAGTTNAKISWTPDSSQTGSSMVTVRATDTTSWFATRTFSIQVANVNDAPVVANDSYTIIQGTSLVAAGLNVSAPGVLANDADPDGDAITVASNSLPTVGTLNYFNADGSFSYSTSPTNDFSGVATFTYLAKDPISPTLMSNTATVSINVIANRPPVATADTVDAPIRRNINTTGSIAAGSNSLTVASTAWLKVGDTIKVSGAGVPDLTAKIHDITGTVILLDTTAVVSVTGAAVTGIYQPVLINVLANDTDPDTVIDPTNNIDPASITIVTKPNNGGAISVDPVTGIISYTPSPNFGGADSFSYKVNDTYNPAATSNTVTVRVNVML